MTYYNDNTCAWTKYYTVRVVVSSFGGIIMYGGHQTDFIRMDYLESQISYHTGMLFL